MIYDVAVLGGGVAGMFAAITAARNGQRVCIVEKNNELGKKIYATGNGRCNFTNARMNPSYYTSVEHGCSDFLENVFDAFSRDDLLEMLNELGMPYYEREGYYYPYSNSAVSFVRTLINEVENLKVDVEYDFNVRSITREDTFIISNKQKDIRARKCIVAAGGNAMPKSGSSGDLYYYLKGLGHTIIKPLPSLCKLKCEMLQKLVGVKAFGKVTLMIDGKASESSFGQLQFVKDAISGIPVFQVSEKAVRALDEGRRVELRVCFLDSDEDTACDIDKANIYNSNIKTTDLYKVISREVRSNLIQVLHEKVVDALFDKYGIDRDAKLTLENVNSISNISDIEDEKIAMLINELLQGITFEITDYGDFNEAQCTSGGVAISEINPTTMESTVCRGLYLAGEIIDITGKCGGYNIQLAASTGVVAGRLN